MPCYFVRDTVRALLNLVYPPCCLNCAARLPESATPLCHRCLSGLERARRPQWTSVLEQRPEVRDALDGLFVLWLFDEGGTVQRIQHQLKYGNRPRYGVALGALLGSAYGVELDQGVDIPTPEIVLPVPLHRTRRYERGYNQSAMLAHGVAKTLGIAHEEDALARHRVTPSQTHLSRQRRWANVSGAFALRSPEVVRNRHVLLIDDVLTTGATLGAAAATLREAHPASIHAATLALAR